LRLGKQRRSRERGKGHAREHEFHWRISLLLDSHAASKNKTGIELPIFPKFLHFFTSRGRWTHVFRARITLAERAAEFWKRLCRSRSPWCPTWSSISRG